MYSVINKKTSLFLLVLTLLATSVQAQSLRERMKLAEEKLNSKLDALEEGPDYSAEFEGRDFESLDVIAAKWTDGSYMAKEPTSQPNLYEMDGSRDVLFEKDATGKVTSIEINSEKYFIENDGVSDYVQSYFRGGVFRLYLTEKTIVMYNQGNGNFYLQYILGEKVHAKKIMAEITAYREYAVSRIEGDNAAEKERLAEIAKKEEAARKVKYGLAGKSVKSIEVINVEMPDKFGHYMKMSYDLQATLADGTKISTKGYDQGYTSDYDITVTGYPLEKGWVDNDKIVIKAAVKGNPSVSTTKEIPIQYTANIQWKWNAYSSYGNNGKAANDFRIEIKQVKHAVTGDKLLKVRVTNLTTGKVIDEVKIGIDATLFFYAIGGPGDEYDGKVTNGGSGGDITVIKDPSVEYFNLTYENRGGSGGVGTYSRGSKGQDGRYKVETRAVSF